MTKEEFKQFTRTLFVQMPGLMNWVKTNSPDPELTMASWERTLAPVTFAEALGVLADWENGNKKIPEAYERDVIAVVIRQCAFADRDQQRKQDRKLDEQHRLSIEGRRRAYRPAALGIPSVLESYKLGRKLRADFLDGKMTEEEYRQRFNELVSSA